MTNNSAETDVIEDDIRTTRQGIDDKVRRIQDRLSPGDVVDGVVDFLRSNGGALAGGVGRGLRDNPVPAALIGTGVAWFALSAMNRRRADHDDVVSGGRLQRKAAAARDSLGEQASHATERAGEIRQDATRRAKHAAAASGDFVKEHPILVGAAGIVLGAAVAASLPRWQREDRLYGKQSDEVKSAAKRAAAEQGRNIQDSAKEAVEKAKQAAEAKTSAKPKTG